MDSAGAVALTIAAISWSVSSVLTRRLPLPASKVMSSGAQMLAGGMLLALTAAARGQFRNFRPWIVSREAGSIIAFTAYVWLIHHESPTKVGIYAYVNPVVVGPRSILGTLFVLISVVVITPTRVKKPVRALAVEDTGLTPVSRLAFTHSRQGTALPTMQAGF